MTSNAIFLLNLVSTLYLVGLIWTIQIVHYPLFDRVGQPDFVAYETAHNRLITPVVGPIMVVELTTAVLLAFGPCPIWISRQLAIAGLLAVIAIWASTLLLQVPCHTRLLQGFDRDTYRQLVATNWIRTLLWTARGLLLVHFLWRGLQTVPMASLES